MSRSDEHQAAVTDDEVRTEEGIEELEQANPTHGGQQSVNKILKEAQVVGGSDNTARPAGGNADEVGSREPLERVVQSETAQDNYATEDSTEPGITST